MSKEMSLNEKLEKLMDRFEEMDEKINFGSEFKTEYDVNWYTDIREALQRLEAIDNSNPSEALECLLRIYTFSEDVIYQFEKEYNTIKQALLKAQEPKQYLKWEDLEFDEDGQETLVLLNDTKYRMYYYKGYDECINLFTEDEISVIHIFEGCSPQDKQFFNDLHLERVE